MLKEGTYLSMWLDFQDLPLCGRFHHQRNYVNPEQSVRLTLLEYTLRREHFEHCGRTNEASRPECWHIPQAAHLTIREHINTWHNSGVSHGQSCSTFAFSSHTLSRTLAISPFIIRFKDDTAMFCINSAICNSLCNFATVSHAYYRKKQLYLRALFSALLSRM